MLFGSSDSGSAEVEKINKEHYFEKSSLRMFHLLSVSTVRRYCGFLANFERSFLDPPALQPLTQLP